MKRLTVCFGFLLLLQPLFADQRLGPEARKVIESLKTKIAKAKKQGNERAVVELKKALEQHMKGIVEGKKREEAKNLDMELGKLIEKIAELRKIALHARNEGRLEKARDAWLKADQLDEQLQNQLKGKLFKRPRPPQPFKGDFPGEFPQVVEKIDHLYKEAHQGLEKDNWEVAAKNYFNIFKILSNMEERFRGPEERNVILDQAKRLFEGVEVLRKNKKNDLADKLNNDLDRLVGFLERNVPERAGSQHSEEADNIRQRVEELSNIEREIGEKAQDLERKHNELEREHHEIERKFVDRDIPGEVKQRLHELESNVRDIEVEFRHINEKHSDVVREREKLERLLQGIEGRQAEGRERERRQAEGREPERRQAEGREREEEQGREERMRPRSEEEQDNLWAEIHKLKDEIRELRGMLREALEKK